MQEQIELAPQVFYFNLHKPRKIEDVRKVYTLTQVVKAEWSFTPFRSKMGKADTKTFRVRSES